MKHLRPVPQPTEQSEQKPSCLSCRKLKRINGQLRRQLLLVCRNFLRARAHSERLRMAIVRESHYMDVRTPNTGKPTRERITNGRPVTKGE